MRDELIYHEYAGWKLEHCELLNNLKELDSPIGLRVSNILSVLDFLYDKLIDDPSYSDEEDGIFNVGFQYIHQQVDEISSIISDIYNEDFEAFSNDGIKVNLLLNTIGFQEELLNYENLDTEGLNFFLNFEQEIIEKLKKKETIDESMFKRLDNESDKIFKRLSVDYYPIEIIFLEIADELGII